MSNLASLLFETKAFKICEENKPFWLTAGTISPYFVNTHFLYGSEESANKLLDFINNELEHSEKKDIPAHVFKEVLNEYNTNTIYKEVVDTLKNYIENNIDIEKVDYVSGGERRDWFFSNMIAYLLKKPHITLFKDQSSIVSNFDFTENTIPQELENKKVLHIADLLTQASSYSRFWIPAIHNLKANIVWSFAIVNRLQGGDELLKENNIDSYSLLQIDLPLFEKALELNIINENQLSMLKEFKKDPYNSMREFLVKHPEFLQNALNSDAKTASRAKSCIDNDYYKLK